MITNTVLNSNVLIQNGDDKEILTLNSSNKLNQTLEEKSSVAFVLIMCNFDIVKNILNQLDEIKSITETVVVEGPWKIILKFEAANLDHIREDIRWKIRKMDGIESTLTLVEYMS